ncbi:TonB-dependent receptor plug domain-containing protein [Cecembia lonarensis]|uniref:Outer membrane cobalamin receptor protein n=1 Tax=Cecembia lonarensis (strain CCUG 58316 / KCTC 22772 / LW9) TaxID=1225176 RepID=K1L6N3_CECL9|nr:TonB-dependent receptor plug domain-containing protein [Cecembia lonarensis]EKB47727.1 Outer membrane cobalamin receptor protein [Cecembia lonarensis LW9]
MNVKKTSFLFVAMLVLPLAISFAQNPIDRLVENIEAYHKTYPFEKIYLHTDKPHYFLNDTIWIKAYGLMDLGEENSAKTTSVPLYVELLQQRALPYVSRIIIKLEDGLGQGDIVLPRNLTPGVYTLRAYTEWMRNFGEEVFFEKNLWVGELGDGWTFEESQPDLRLNFFPEGGYLVNGISSMVGFKATNARGKGKDILGYILNSKQDTVLRFESEYMGMGSFEFMPKQGETYEVVARSSEQVSKKLSLTNIQEEGIVLAIDTYSDEDLVKINVQHNIRFPSQQLHLLIQSRDKIVHRIDFDASKKIHEFELFQDDFLPGIHTFTLLDEETRLLAERIVYLLPFAQGKANFITEKSTYSAKDRVRMDIEVMDEFGSPVMGNFSVSVTDAYQVMHLDHAEDIVSYLNLVSELKGVIENPGYYFNQENPHAIKYLDNLLLTQGWRRFSWENLSKMSDDPKYLVESGLSLSGRVFRANDKPVDEVHQLTMLVQHFYGGPIIYEGQTDSLGNFTFIGMDFQDTVGIYLQAHLEIERRRGRKREVKRNDLEIFEKEIPEPRMASLVGLPTGDQYRDFDDYIVTVKEARDIIEQYRRGRELELGEVTIRGRRSEPFPDNRAIQYNNNPELSMVVTDEFYGFQNIYQLIRGRFPGVNVVGNVFDFVNPPAILMRGGQIGGSGLQGARIFIDGMPVDPLWAMNLPVPEIERIDILRSLSKSSVFGADGAGGVVNILTKGGNPNRDWSEVDVLGNATIVSQGYAPIREFYTPPAVPEINAPFALDFRSTIYWQPMVQTDPRGKAFIEFRLTEGSPDVRVSLEGLSVKGEAVKAHYTFKVSD